MGFFSWTKSNDGKPVRNRYTEEGATPCKILLPDGKVIICSTYEGYGVFIDDNTGESIDWYEECARLNGFGTDRDRGIDIGLEPNPDTLLPKIVSRHCRKRWSELPNSKEAPCQGFF